MTIICLECHERWDPDHDAPACTCFTDDPQWELEVES